MLQPLGFAPILDNGYPTSDGRPMAETDWHVDLILKLIESLRDWFSDRSDVYVAGNNFVFYEPGNKRRHVSPDVYVVRGVRNYLRPNYLVWEEGKGPDVVFELTSRTTRHRDLGHKFELYRDVLRVKEYFLFDPKESYLEPSMQGFRLVKGEYRRIRPIDGRIPSKVLGLHLERSDLKLRLWDPATKGWIPTGSERAAKEFHRAESEKHRADYAEELADIAEQRADLAELIAAAERDRALAARERELAAQERADALAAEVERLRQQLEQRGS